MSCVIKEVFLSEYPYFQTYVTVLPDKDPKLYIHEIFHEPNVTGGILVFGEQWQSSGANQHEYCIFNRRTKYNHR